MVHFRTSDLVAISIFAALWGILNVVISPVFFQIFHLPFACDLIGFATLVLAIWWSRKIGTTTFVGLIALTVNLLARPAALHFFGFFVASVFFDVLVFASGYCRLFERRFLGSVILFAVSVISAAIAGAVIGSLFMAAPALAQWGGVLGWSGLHAIGGAIGGAVGVAVMNALSVRGLTPRIGSKRQWGGTKNKTNITQHFVD